MTRPTYGEYATRRIVRFPFVEVASGRGGDGGSRAVRVVTVAYETGSRLEVADPSP